MFDWISSMRLSRRIAFIPALFIGAIAGRGTYSVVTSQAQATDARDINIAGRQRMLSQKYTKEVIDEIFQVGEAVGEATGRVEAASAQIAADRSYYAERVVARLLERGDDIHVVPGYHKHPSAPTAVARSCGKR